MYVSTNMKTLFMSHRKEVQWVWDFEIFDKRKWCHSMHTPYMRNYAEHSFWWYMNMNTRSCLHDNWWFVTAFSVLSLTPMFASCISPRALRKNWETGSLLRKWPEISADVNSAVGETKFLILWAQNLYIPLIVTWVCIFSLPMGVYSIGNHAIKTLGKILIVYKACYIFPLGCTAIHRGDVGYKNSFMYFFW